MGVGGTGEERGWRWTERKRGGGEGRGGLRRREELGLGREKVRVGEGGRKGGRDEGRMEVGEGGKEGGLGREKV